MKMARIKNEFKVKSGKKQSYQCIKSMFVKFMAQFKNFCFFCFGGKVVGFELSDWLH